MEQYTQKPKPPKIERQKRTKQEFNDYDDNDDYEDDMKLFDLKQKLELKPKNEESFETGPACRACADMEARVDIFDHKDDEGTDLAAKLKLLGGIEVRISYFKAKILSYPLRAFLY